ncbi:MAG: histidine triad nucleotide-binding protein [Candidatus Melainabacteria bacterium]|nr:histidine triad nucleotide-binding protein [Candidatus Melainabacteria bacterium]
MSDNREPNCIFCKIVAGEIPAKLVAQDEHFVAFRDINAQAPTHILVVPRRHAKNILEVKDTSLMGHLFSQAGEIAQKEQLDGGFRLVVNTGDDGGQTVHHLHIHILGGRAMSWPPG